MGYEYLTQDELIAAYFEAKSSIVLPPWMDEISNYFTTPQSEKGKYPITGAVPRLREGVEGQRTYINPRVDNVEITNLFHEVSMNFKKSELRRDQTGQLMMRIGEFADADAEDWVKKITTLITGGEATTTAYDGNFFFDTNHKKYDTNGNLLGTYQSNIKQIDISASPVTTTGDTTNPSVESMAYAITQGIATLQAVEDTMGEKRQPGASQFRVLCPTTLGGQAIDAVSSRFLDGGRSNVIPGNTEYTVQASSTAYLNDFTAKFVIFHTGKRAKPFIRQEEDMIELQTLWLDSEHAAKNDEVLAMLTGWRNAKAGMWEDALLIEFI